MFRLNRSRPVSRWTIARLLLKSIFVRSSGQPRWKGIFGVIALGALVAFGWNLTSPQHVPAPATQNAVAVAQPAAVAVQPIAPAALPAPTIANSISPILIVRFKRTFNNSAYRALDMREDALERTSTVTQVVSYSEFKQSMEAYGTDSDMQSLEQILESNCTKSFTLTAGQDQFAINYDEMGTTAAFLAALKANPLVDNAWLQ